MTRIQDVQPLRAGAPEPRWRITHDNEWVYRNRTLVHRRTRYEVDLDLCGTSSAVLDWIFQIFRKTWCTEKTLRDLLLHLQDRINPQATLCGGAMLRSDAVIAR